MKEQDLLYHFPYHIDKEHSFRHFAYDNIKFVRKYIPSYDGTNLYEFLINKSGLTKDEISEFSYINENYVNWANWFKNGKNIFSFSFELLSMLEKTDVSNVKPDSFHLPYDIFYLSLKPLNIKISKDSNKIVEGVYIDHNIWDYNGEHPEGYCDLSFYFVGDFRDIFLKNISTVKSRTPYTINNQEKFDEYPVGSFWNVWLSFQKSEGRENVKQAIDYFLDELKDELFSNKPKNEELTDIELDFYNATTGLLKRTINLVINCMLYLSQPSEKKDIKKEYPHGLPQNFDRKLKFAKTKKDLKKVSNKIDELGFTKIHYVGKSFKNRQNTETVGDISTHWRRGHWRNQKCGKEKLQSKTIWIMPTIVNKDKGEVEKGHIYDVDNERNK